jgi:hypothetical protein
MKKWEVKTINVSQQTDLEAELNAEGQNGWRFAHALATPFGVKFLLERQLDEEVSAADNTSELMKKFGV